MNINSDISSSLLSLFGYGNQTNSKSNIFSSSLYQKSLSSDSVSLSNLAKSLLSDSESTTQTQSVTYYQLGIYGKIIEDYAGSQALSTQNSEENSSDTDSVESNVSSEENQTNIYGWNMALSSTGQNQIRSGILRLYEESSGETREQLRKEILEGLQSVSDFSGETVSSSGVYNTAGTFLTAKSSQATTPWQQLRNFVLGSDGQQTLQSQVLSKLTSSENSTLTLSQSRELTNLQQQALAVSNYTEFASYVSKFNLSG